MWEGRSVGVDHYPFVREPEILAEVEEKRVGPWQRQSLAHENINIATGTIGLKRYLVGIGTNREDVILDATVGRADRGDVVAESCCVGQPNDIRAKNFGGANRVADRLPRGSSGIADG